MSKPKIRRTRRQRTRPRRRSVRFETLEARRLLALSDPLVSVAGIAPAAQPPDTILDVGPNHVIQMTNRAAGGVPGYQVFDKHGAQLTAPINLASLWPAGDTCAGGRTDPIVVYDQLADRWNLNQVITAAAGGPAVCIAISQTADPVNGADGIANNGDEWFVYTFDGASTPAITTFPDYQKFGVWPDAYYMSSHEGGVHGIFAFDRTRMLAGDPTATFVRTTMTNVSPSAGYRNARILPADLDGPAPPPGTPALFLRTIDDNQDTADARDRIEIYEVVPDFTAGTLSVTLIDPDTDGATIDADDGLAAFDTMTCNRNGAGTRDCIPQPDTLDTLDALSNRPMMQLKFRNFGTHFAMVVNQTVDVQDVIQSETGYAPANEAAGIRWYELQSTDGGSSWDIAQQGDYAPQPNGLSADAQILHRWMGSAAMDKDGNIALGYNIANSDNNNEVFPGIRYAGRRYDDAADQLPQVEKVILNGVNSHGNTNAVVNPQRWGDYSAMSVDPVDDCTFWYTSHVAGAAAAGSTVGSGAKPTQIASFRFDTCRPPDAFEPNDTLADATILGSLQKITLRNATINDEEDIDYYKYTAQDSGKLIVNAFTGQENNLQLRVLDASGDLVESGVTGSDVPGLSKTGVVIPVVTQEQYFIEVLNPGDQFFEYHLEIENFPAPIPIAVDLAAADDTGMSDSDNVTFEDEGRITILADLSDFAAMGIDILTPAEVSANEPGAAVEVFAGGSSLGIADPIPGTNSTLYTFDFDPGDLSEGLNVVTTAVRMYDGKSPQADGRSQMSEPLLLTLDRTAPSTPPAPDLLASSDTGMLDDDNVTNKMQPAFDGTTERNAKVRVEADGRVVGQGVATSSGAWEVTVEPLDDGVHDITVEVEDLAGNVSAMSSALQIEIDTLAPNTPFLDLVEADDSGRHDDDNITNVTTPLLSATTHDPNSGIHLFADNFKYRIYDRLEESAETLLFDSFAAIADFTDLTQVYTTADLLDGTTAIGTLLDGIHNLKLEAEDRAGNISHDFLLEVLVDTVAPEGTANLFPDSDSGIWGFPETMTDLVTSDMTPLLFGATEANALVRAAIDDEPAGTAVAVPYDGDDAFPPPAEFDGNYFLQTILNLEDGAHTIEVFFQDVAGNESLADDDATLEILIDTNGPRITNVTRGLVSDDNLFTFDGDTSLFEPKPSPTGPDPLVHSLVVHFSDLPDRTDDFADMHALFEEIAAEEGNYQVIGDHNGNIAIAAVNVSFSTEPGDLLPETAEVELVFDQPLPDDRYTLWVSDSISDPAGNPLDGESGARAPFDGNDVPDETPPVFPTGDGEHGGDFYGRFTIDSRPEIGTYALGTSYLDINGNETFDPEGKDRDYTNRDIVFLFGLRDDRIFAGDFAAGTAVSSTGYDKLGAYGVRDGVGSKAWHWRLDFDHDGVIDFEVVSGVQGEGAPVAGDFDPTHPGDEIGLFNAGKWFLDTTGNNNIGDDGDTELQGDLRGFPVVGDFDGDGLDDLATWNPGNAGLQTDGQFEIDLADNGLSGDADRIIEFDLSGVFERPVAADMNADGIDDLGLFVTRREGVTPAESGEWFFLISDDPTPTPGEVTALNHPFTPVPFGTDLFAQFGDEVALPVVGNFDPPTAGPASILDEPLDTNPMDAMDVNNDGHVTPADALTVLNALNAGGAGDMSGSNWQAPFLDANGDDKLTPADLLTLVNYLNQQADQAGSAAEGESVRSAVAGEMRQQMEPVADSVALETDLVGMFGDAPDYQRSADLLFGVLDKPRPSGQSSDREDLDLDGDDELEDLLDTIV